MLLAEADGYDQSLAQLKQVQEEAERKIQDLVVRINATESQLAALTTKRELLRARQLTAEGQELLAQVDQLMSGNSQAIQANPVRTVRELLDAPAVRPNKTASQEQVEEFLAAEPGIGSVPPPAPIEPVSVHATSTKIKKRPKPASLDFHTRQSPKSSHP